jgi:hypothetical protein
MPNGNLGTARGDVVTPLLMPDGTPIKAPPVQNNARYTAVFTTMMKSFVDIGMPVTDDQLVSALMAAQSAADGTMPAPAGAGGAEADPKSPQATSITGLPRHESGVPVVSSAADRDLLPTGMTYWNSQTGKLMKKQ